MTPTMLDLFAGLGGASAAMKERGWRVISIEILPKLKPDIVADVRHLPILPFPVDLIWASPPCTYYTRKYLERHGRLYKDEPDPDLTLWQESERIIDDWNPRYWVIENVQGAVRYHGQPNFRLGSRLLWTNIPLLSKVDDIKRFGKHKANNPWRSQAKSKIPYPVSCVVASAVEALQ